MQFENGSEILASAPIYAEEEKVINGSEWGAIRTLYERGKSKKAIARGSSDWISKQFASG